MHAELINADKPNTLTFHFSRWLGYGCPGKMILANVDLICTFRMANSNSKENNRKL